jgi:hypothetical protein
MRFILMVSLVLFSAPMHAEGTKCLAAPDQDWLFDLAFEAALADERLDDLAGVLLSIAA